MARAAADLDPGREQEEQEELPIVEHAAVGDEQLRLVLLCCHPAIAPDAQVALTLRLVGGLTVREIAGATLEPEPTVAQRIARAKRRIRQARIPFTIPADLDERVAVVLRILLLIFNEGSLTRGNAPEAMRLTLVETAIRMTRAASALLPDHAEVSGLLALELYGRARWSSRAMEADLVLMSEQDRSSWDRAAIEEAHTILRSALELDQPGPLQVQALIASLHAAAPTFAASDWPLIAALYARLEDLDPSPIVRLNRAVAVAYAEGPGAALDLLDTIDGLDGYHLLHAARGELLLRMGAPGAREAFGRALALATSEPERRHLLARLAAQQPLG
jgi:RNA polymerase sigma-70 factor (ECF subfamily)